MRFLVAAALLPAILFAENSAAGEDRPPTATVAEYRPLSSRERLDFYWNRNFLGPGAYFASAGRSIGDQFNDQPPEWGQGMEGYSKRLASNFAAFSIQTATESAGAALLGQDPRYIALREEGGWRRLGHALSSSVLTYDRRGRRVLAPARVAGPYAGAFSTLAWFPSRFGPKDALRDGTQRLMVGALTNVAREFWPEIRGLFGGKRER